MNRVDDEAEVPVLERVHRWLEERPRRWQAIRLSAAVLGTALLVALGAVAGAVLGGLFTAAGAVLWVAVADPGAAVIDDSVDGVVRLGSLLVLVGAVAGGVWTSFRLLGGPREEDARPREAIARGVVSQAIVARALGQEVRRLGLGLLAGGRLERSRTASSGPSRAKAGFDELVVLFADPATNGWSDDLDPAWVRRVSEQADLLVAQSAVDGGSAVLSGRAELLGRAAQLSRDIVGSVPDDVAESIEHELCLAGTMRGQRFELLLDRALAERAEGLAAGALPAG